jgi:hypothetical protein
MQKAKIDKKSMPFKAMACNIQTAHCGIISSANDTDPVSIFLRIFALSKQTLSQ